MKNITDFVIESISRFDADQIIRDYLDKKNKENHADIDEDTLSDITMEITELWEDEGELRNIKSEKQLIKKLEQTLPYLHDKNETDRCYVQTIKGLRQEQFDKLIGK